MPKTEHARRKASILQKLFFFALVLALLGASGGAAAAPQPEPQPDQPEAPATEVPPSEDQNISAASKGSRMYIPIVTKVGPVARDGDILLGIYPLNWWAPKPQDVIDNEFKPLDEWTGKQTSLAGVYHIFEDNNKEFNITFLLGELWRNGYTPFVNIYSNSKAVTIASGGLDSHIREWARYYAQYAKNGRMAFLAPLWEMNGYWVPYTGNPEAYIQAFRRIVSIFNEEGVPRDSVRWVFAPNGYTDRRDSPFQSYYPGSAYVDVIGFSSYNFGYACDANKWETPEQIYGKYLPMLREMAPGKPIIVAQTGTSAHTSGGYNANAKNQWLVDAYDYLASEPYVQGIMYYNAVADGCDWLIYARGKTQFEGYAQGASNPRYGYYPPQEMKELFPVAR